MSAVFDGFKSVFEQASKHARLDFDSFRTDPSFFFLTANAEQQNTSDENALRLAQEHNAVLCQKYISLEKPRLGYKNLAYHPCDVVDSRHIMMSTILFSFLKNNEYNVVEIGGGFGNWARLNLPVVPIKSWTIIDLPFVSELQQWYLKNALSEDDFSRMRFLLNTDSTADIDVDVVIGTHSLSELSWNDFLSYMPIINRSRYLFYSYHINYPSSALTNIKLEYLKQSYNIIVNIKSENDFVSNMILEKR